MVVFDTTTLLVAIVPPGQVPVCVKGQDIPDARRRVDYLIQCLDKAGKVVIPTPALAEALVRAGADAAQRYIERITRSAAFEIADFGTLAAIEAAEMTREAIASGRLKVGSSGPRQKVKVDRQIVVIAKSRGCSRFTRMTKILRI